MFSLGFHFKTNYFLRSLLMSPWIYYIGRETCSPKIFPSVFFRKSGSSLQLPNVHLPWMKGLCRATNMVSCLSMVNISSIPFHCRWCLLTTSTHFNSWWTSARCFVDEIPRPKARPNSWPIKCWNPAVKFYGRLAAVMRNDLGWYRCCLLSWLTSELFRPLVMPTSGSYDAISFAWTIYWNPIFLNTEAPSSILTYS